MVGNIAHQWRQPLAIISVSVGILDEKRLRGSLTDCEFKEELNHINSNTSHMSQTIEDFLTYFRPNKVKEKFILADAIDKAMLIIGNLLYKEEITLRVDVDKKYIIDGFKEEYVQVLISILTNSIYVLKDKDEKSIYIKSQYLDDKLTLEISDSGGGIQDDIIDRIFEPYFTTKHQTVGTGLGLYITKMIIENSMNGTIKVTNTTSGAKFSITI